MSMNLVPVEVIGGVSNSQATVGITGVAPAGGFLVRLSSSNTNAATVPATVTIPAGQRTATFTVTSRPVSSDVNVSIRASLNNANAVARVLRVKSFGVASLSFLPNKTVGGLSVQMTVRLEAPAPAGGAVVQIDKGGNGQIVNLPTTITIPAGQISFSQKYTTNAVSRTLRTAVSALYRNKTATAVLEVNPKVP